MKVYFKIVLISCLCLFSCKKKEDQRGVPPIEANSNKDINVTSSKSQVEFTTPKNKELYLSYLNLKAALVNTNVTASKKAATNFSTAFKNDSTYSRARQIAVLIAAENKIEKQREFFVGLTSEVTSVLQEDVKSGKIFQQYCPMAFEGKGGYWLSDSEEIRNPYFGDQMLVCGEVVKTIK